MIKKYYKKLDKVLERFSHIIEDQNINKKAFADDKGLIEGEIYFINESCLEFLEVINTNILPKEKYKYQYMNKDKHLIFRYDNANHHRELKTFPHHKHITNLVIESMEPNLDKVLSEIENKLI